MSKIAILIDGDKVEVHNLSAETAVNATTGQTVPYSSEIADMFTMQKGGTAPDHGQQGGSSAGGSTFRLGTVSPDANGDLPALFVSEGGELKINWPDNSEAFLPINISSGLAEGTKVSFKTYGSPDTGSEIYATLSPSRGNFANKDKTVDHNFPCIIAKDLTGYTRLDAGAKLYLNMGGKSNGGFTAVQVTISK